MSSEISVNLSDGPSATSKVVSIIGEMDESNLDTIHKAIDPILNNPAIKTMIFNLHDLAFINSKGIGFLVFLQTHLAKDGRKFILTDANEEVMDVITLVGLTSIIPYFPTLEESYDSVA